MNLNWRFITNFGDTIVIVPCMLFFLSWLLLHKEMRSSVRYFFCTFLLLAFITAITKILFQAFGIGSKTLNFTGVSGHSLLPAFFWPLFLYYSVGIGGLRANIMFFLGAAFSAFIGLGLLVTQSHSLSEVILGLVIGWGTTLFLIKRYPLRHRLPLIFSIFLVVFSLVIASTELRAPTYHFFREVSKFLSDDGKVQKRKELYGSDIKS